MNIRNLLLWLSSMSPFRYKATKCGHRTKRTGRVSAFGHSITTKMSKNNSGSVDYCLDCISKMAIRCAWCGNPIFIGDPITLYSSGPRIGFLSSAEPSKTRKIREGKKFLVPDHAFVYCENPLTLVGCLRWSCADTGADRAGFWLPGEDGEGYVYRVKTIYESMFSSEESSIVIVSDIYDIEEATS